MAVPPPYVGLLGKYWNSLGRVNPWLSASQKPLPMRPTVHTWTSDGLWTQNIFLLPAWVALHLLPVMSQFVLRPQVMSLSSTQLWLALKWPVSSKKASVMPDR